MIKNKAENLYKQVFQNLSKEKGFSKKSFDNDIRVWLIFKLQIESVMSGNNIETGLYLSKLVDKANYEIDKIKECKSIFLRNPKGCKKLWDVFLGNDNQDAHNE